MQTRLGNTRTIEPSFTFSQIDQHIMQFVTLQVLPYKPACPLWWTWHCEDGIYQFQNVCNILHACELIHYFQSQWNWSHWPRGKWSFRCKHLLHAVNKTVSVSCSALHLLSLAIHEQFIVL